MMLGKNMHTVHGHAYCILLYSGSQAPARLDVFEKASSQE